MNDIVGSSSLSSLITNGLLFGTFTFDDTSGVITVAPSYLSQLKLKATLFKDSNVGFSIPISAKIRDSALIDGVAVYDDAIQQGTMVVKLKGTADVPTVFVDSEVSGGNRIPISLGGVSTDTDVALGRTASERIHYFVSAITLAGISAFHFVDSSNSPVGFAGGEKTWSSSRRHCCRYS